QRAGERWPWFTAVRSNDLPCWIDGRAVVRLSVGTNGVVVLKSEAYGVNQLVTALARAALVQQEAVSSGSDFAAHLRQGGVDARRRWRHDLAQDGFPHVDPEMDRRSFVWLVVCGQIGGLREQALALSWRKCHRSCCGNAVESREMGARVGVVGSKQGAP